MSIQSVLDYSVPPTDRGFIHDRELLEQKTVSSLPASAASQIECEIKPIQRVTDRSNMYAKFTLKMSTGKGYMSGWDAFGLCDVKNSNGDDIDDCKDAGLISRVLGYVTHSAAYRDNHNQVKGWFADGTRPFIGTGTIEMKVADLDAGVGTGTDFLNEVAAGDRILFSDGVLGTVLSVASSTSLALTANLAGAVADTNYMVIPAAAATYFDALNGSGVEITLPLGEAFGFFRDNAPWCPLYEGLKFNFTLNSDARAIQSPVSTAAFQITDFYIVGEKFTLSPQEKAKFEARYLQEGLYIHWDSFVLNPVHYVANGSTVQATDEYNRNYSNLKRSFLVRQFNAVRDSRLYDSYALDATLFGTYQAEFKDKLFPRKAISSTPQLFTEYWRNVGLLGESDMDSISYTEFTSNKQIICTSWEQADNLHNVGVDTLNNPIKHKLVLSADPGARVDIWVIDQASKDMLMKMGETPVIHI